MNKIIFNITLFLGLGLVPIMAQNAKSILDKAADTYAQSGAVTAKFTLNTKELNSKHIYSQDGTAHMKGDKFKIEVPEAITWFDGKTQWIYMKDSQEVNITNPTGAELQAISPSMLFSIYKHGYDLKYNGEKTVSGKVVLEVEMTAQHKKIDLKKVIVQINKSTNIFSKIVLTDVNGMENTLTINSYTTNNSLTDNSFVFNKKDYPDVELIDLR